MPTTWRTKKEDKDADKRGCPAYDRKLPAALSPFLRGAAFVDMQNSASSSPVPCDLCGSTDAEELSLIDRDGKYLRTVINRQSGHVYSEPRPTHEQVRDYYEHQYRNDYKATFQPKPKHVYRAGKVAVERFLRLKPILKPGCKILDMGAGGGEMLFVLRAMGFDASGFEPNEGYARFASETLGLPVSHGFYQEASIPADSLDVVTAFHVFEHLESPLDAMRHVRPWLRTGGHLLIEVPNVEAVCQWPRSRFHRAHLYNFNPATLEMTGRKAGYKVVSTTVSDDGGNVSVIYQKADDVPPVTGEIPGNYERVRAIVRGHTALKHAFSKYPYIRPFRKIAQRLDERRAISQETSPKAILEGIVARSLK
jgi:2-polyprenyl-3-methyl-5-hydroxy-6-metoxy-1,4-benzoquinol methylase